MHNKFGAVLAAGGSSTRMGGGRSKILEPLGDRPVFCRSLETMLRCEYIGEVCIVCREQDREEIAREAERLAAETGRVKPICFASAGAQRQDSVWNGAQALRGGWEYLVFHDGARPFANARLFEAVCRDAMEVGAATAAVPSKDTCKLMDDNGFVESTPNRERLMAVQTPQAFRRELYVQAAVLARSQSKSYTDDCQLVEAAGGRVKLTPADYQNFKITTRSDLFLARAMVGDKEKPMRIGSGYDVHKLVEGRRLILGGVDIPFERGLLGHSDADVLAHAIADALLGAAAMGDIGHLFPDNDPQYAGADSLKLLGEVCRVVREAGHKIGNIDATVIAQRPRLAPHIPQMRENLARACGIDVGQVSVKATTEEGLGFTGSGEGIAASAVCLLA